MRGMLRMEATIMTICVCVLAATHNRPMKRWLGLQKYQANFRVERVGNLLRMEWIAIAVAFLFTGKNRTVEAGCLTPGIRRYGKKTGETCSGVGHVSHRSMIAMMVMMRRAEVLVEEEKVR